MNGLVEFLLARIAEDEAAATDEAVARASVGTVVGGPGVPAHAVDQAQAALLDLRRACPWSSAFGPARVLAECAAKREIVQWYGLDDEPALKVLAAIYADHPDYQEVWRP